MHKRMFTLDEACLNWYLYHFDDTWLANDVSWQLMREMLGSYLSNDQLAGSSCAVCDTHITYDMQVHTSTAGGYNLRYCSVSCTFPPQRIATAKPIKRN